MGWRMLLGVEPEQVRVIAPDVGGGFGGKGLATEDVIVAWLARADRPAGALDRDAQREPGRDGSRPRAADRVRDRRHARRTRPGAAAETCSQDAGAYPDIGAFLPNLTALMASGVYRIPKIDVRVRIGGRPTRRRPGPSAAPAVPRPRRRSSARSTRSPPSCGLDPADVRRRTSFRPTPSRSSTATGANYDIGDYGRALDLALEHRRLRAAPRGAGGAPEQRLAAPAGHRPEPAYVEITNGINETEFGAVEITGDGDAIVKTGSFSHGQGHETTFAQIAADRLGIPIEKITVVKGDTDAVARGTGTYGSKSTQIGGVAAGQASEEVVEHAKRLAAEELEASPEDMVLDLDPRRASTSPGRPSRP